MLAQSPKRISPRAPYEKEIIYKAVGQPNCKGIVQNLSASGAYLLSGQAIIAGTKVVIYLPLAIGKRKRVCTIEGEVTRSTQEKQSLTRGHGIKFESEITVINQEMIEDYVTYRYTGEVPVRRSTSPESYMGVQVVRQIRKQDRIKEISEKKQAESQSLAGFLLEKLKIAYCENTKLFLVIIALGSLGIWSGAHLIRQSIWISGLNGVVAMSDVQINEGTLKAQVSQPWLAQTPNSSRRSQLIELAQILAQKSVYSAILHDENFRRVALILRNSSKPNEPLIRLFQ